MELTIYTSSGKVKVKPNATIKTFKALQSFCASNNLPSGRISKLQGGYYFLTDEFKWEFFASSLNDISFEQFYNHVKRETVVSIYTAPTEEMEVKSCHGCPCGVKVSMGSGLFICDLLKEIIDTDPLDMLPNCPLKIGQEFLVRSMVKVKLASNGNDK